ncbi:MAG TPA: tRNA dihydrouridine synthase DusB [Candidatus Nanopelagicaceae bacterium]|nr:tRNA dihydrouridine synthase DusB [Candidatus Nanopelagicaceae bacterium]
MASPAPAGLLIPEPLRLGKFTISTPVVLAPMAGITNSAFRQLCREQGAGLFVSEMVTARALTERHPETLRMIAPGSGESPRSIQLYAVDAKTAGDAARMLASENLADHIDLNFGCPVPKVTRKGGGAALPYKHRLFGSIVESVVSGAAPYGIPVTVKMRKGIDDEHLTFLRAGRIAAEAGVAWVALHGRTAGQMYGGKADWQSIADLVAELAPMAVPVLGNGDIWSAADAQAMMAQTHCAGVVVGRGCLGRPWLFGELSAALNGKPIPAAPGLSAVSEIMFRHAELLAQHFADEFRACRDFRKHVAWYLKGFTVRNPIRVGLAQVSSLVELRRLLDQLDGDQEFPTVIGQGPRGRSTPSRPVSLPQGWLKDPDGFPVVDSDEAFSGG